MILRVDARWIEESLEEFERRSGREVAIDDWGALAAAVYRHAYELHAGESFYVETPVRAAVLLQMFVVTRPLSDYNGLVGSALAVRYMRDSGESLKPPPGGLSGLVTEIRDNQLALRAIAARLRHWATQ
ncbi:hypothetical protein ACQB60_40455 [Actinomycetota bacterium Odt1-20B]